METIIQTVNEPAFQVLYNNKDITKDITKNLLSITYTDNTEGKSDELEINLEDTDGNWRDGWYPNKGDSLTLSIGYNKILIPCGTFQIDEVSLSGPPDTVSIRALATGVKGSLRTKKSYAHENKTLLQIAQLVAQKNNLTLQSGVAPITLGRVSQKNETDLAFLNRIGYEYGYLFSIRDTKLIFMNIQQIEELSSVTTIDRSDLMEYSIRDKTLQTYSVSKVQYSNPVEKESTDYKIETVNNKDDVPFKFIEAGDTKVIKSKAENRQQAEAKANTAIYRKNTLQQEGNIKVPGNPYLLAGNNFEITGMGVISGVFHIMASVHTIDRSGAYTSDLDIKRVGFVLKVKTKSKKPRKPKQYTTTVIQ